MAVLFFSGHWNAGRRPVICFASPRGWKKEGDPKLLFRCPCVFKLRPSDTMTRRQLNQEQTSSNLFQSNCSSPSPLMAEKKPTTQHTSTLMQSQWRFCFCMNNYYVCVCVLLMYCLLELSCFFYLKKLNVTMTRKKSVPPPSHHPPAAPHAFFTKWLITFPPDDSSYLISSGCSSGEACMCVCV